MAEPEDQDSPLTPFQFLAVNGFIYRGNTQTGDFWRLEADPQDRKKQVWTKIDDRTAATH